MKKSELRQLIKEELQSINEDFDGAYLAPMEIDRQVSALVKQYLKWEKDSYSNYPDEEDASWSTLDGKRELLDYILYRLNYTSRKKDKITIK